MSDIEEILAEIDKYEKSINASITTGSVILKLKSLKLKDFEENLKNNYVAKGKTVEEIKNKIKELDEKKNEINVFLQTGGKTFEELEPMFKSCEKLEEKIKKDLNLKDKTFKEVILMFEKHNEMKKEYEIESKSANLDFVKNNYNLLSSRHLELVNQYKDIEKQRKSLLDDKSIDKDLLEFMIDQLNNDANHIIKNLKNLIEPLKKLEKVSDSNEKYESNSKTEDDINLDELADKMEIDEMNTILNMISGNSRDKGILDSISKRLGVDESKLEEIAKIKNENLQKDDNKSQDDNYQKDDDNSQNESLGDDNKEKKWNVVKGPKGANVKVDTKPEKKKKIKSWKFGEKLKNVVEAKAHIAIFAVSAVAAILLANPTLLAVGGFGYVYKEFNNGKKL